MGVGQRTRGGHGEAGADIFTSIGVPRGAPGAFFTSYTCIKCIFINLADPECIFSDKYPMFFFNPGSHFFWLPPSLHMFAEPFLYSYIPIIYLPTLQSNNIRELQD